MMPDNNALLAAGGGSQFGVWPCGTGQFYWFLTKNAPPGESKTQAAEVLAGWAASIREIVEGTPEEAVVQNDIVDRPPLRWWGDESVTLLGDAAHATTPNLGQGACQAIEDAVVLAVCLRDRSMWRRRWASMRDCASRARPRSCAIRGGADDCCNSIGPRWRR
jgi:2-polyprenyl-6-methoxyphenol hydroxylase-like FAD-dependent oxidoreductase